MNGSRDVNDLYASIKENIRDMENWNQKFGNTFALFLLLFGIWCFIAFFFGIGH